MSTSASPCITGWNHSRFGKLDGIDPEALIGEVAAAAIAHAGLSPEDIGSIHIGNFNGGFLYQDFPSSLIFNTLPQLRFLPAVRVENACATGSAAIHSALNSIRAGQSRHALVIGFEKMTELSTAAVGDVLLKCSYAKEEAGIPGGFAGVFGTIAQAYFDRYGDQSDALAAIAAKNHKNGMSNPYAHMRKDFGFDFCRTPSEKNPFVAGPLKRTDCSLISDGAAAMIISSADVAKGMTRAVQFRAAVHVNDFLPLSKRDPTRFEGGALAWKQALSQAGITLNDLSLVETHDCFTIAELLEYEAMGLAEPGQGARAILDGVTAKDGRLPVNPSGGLKSKGHPIGATGVSMHVMAAMQACHDAQEMQIPHADKVGVFNMGGAAVANYVSILQRVA
ncbi:acetyl-CoA acetyltransferase [Herbaspirillum sp. RTI4]|uniref:acetyl-CoA acetyltransferase n=1 Tax=Herbaspirillum sp. RTI4 TaxID=3048640 RepID=UPI002AB5D746|nr:acetyl-CoA acetyltransferase [Herbaspirillum sp. RTI4]MDY7577969.1 acetyl-CoA acetyltransferase [Herbaspirillum sp. RTI4]MEA9983452.1 acetyl-CoA acetyltransferase [Herbaspirillum sp. RTI4]